MNELALFSGAGGGLLASRLLGWRTVCAVESDAFRRDCVISRQVDGSLDAFPIWGDVRTFDGNEWRGHVDIVSGGFPCQPFSVAGKRLGEVDPRNMWPDVRRIIGEVRPRFVFLENVPALLAAPLRRVVVVEILDLLFGRQRIRREALVRLDGYFGCVLGDLAELGYDTEWGCLSAFALGAPHRRKRVWILATLPDAEQRLVRDEPRRGGGQGRERSPEPGDDGAAGGVARRSDPDADRVDAHHSGHGASEDRRRRAGPPAVPRERADADEVRRQRRTGLPEATGTPGRVPAQGDDARRSAQSVLGGAPDGLASWLHNPDPWGDGWDRDVARVAAGVPDRVKRLEALGDGQVPRCAAEAFRRLWARRRNV